jgi:nitrate/TMAO reductase-like tetraheme cytochrome c subunit
MKRAIPRLLGWLRGRVPWIRQWISGASTPLLVAVAGGVLLVVGVGGVGAYKTYNYVQHDNDFCMSCHLMQEPFDRFSNSAHRGLGCKACHQPNPIERAKMGLRQIFVSPEEITAHAEVSDSKCEYCHVAGEAEDWILVQNSKGHEIHLNSRDPVLADIECVTCHSDSVHEFGATNASCGQRGCHDEAQIQLGGMGELDLSCEACHDFLVPLDAEAPSADPASLSPGAGQCLSCHEMRTRIDIDPAQEPHGAQCGLCHNAHTQRTAAEAVTSCTASLCHTVPEAIEDDHHQWRSIRLNDCVQCHQAHTFKVDGNDCTACHTDIPSGVGGTSDALDSGEEEVASSALGFDGVVFAGIWGGGIGPPGPVTVVEAAPTGAPPAQQPSADTTGFTHARHRSVICRTCHTSGTSIVRNDPEWCASCHHGAPDLSPRDCARCHRASVANEAEFSIAMKLPGGVEDRVLAFAHLRHQNAVCADCHGVPPVSVDDEFTCISCHNEHHESKTVDCLGCHTPPPEWAHDESVVHQTCSAGVCHTRFGVDDPETWGRSVCVICHTDFPPDEPLPPLPRATPRDTLSVDFPQRHQRESPWGGSPTGASGKTLTVGPSESRRLYRGIISNLSLHQMVQAGEAHGGSRPLDALRTIYRGLTAERNRGEER